MKNFYTKEQIKHFRKNIPIAKLIVEILKIPSTQFNGYWKFLCPICGGSKTFTNKDKNIGLCTECDTKFNPIDIVMNHKGIGFKPALDFLDGLKI